MCLYVGLSELAKNEHVDPPAVQPIFTVFNAASSSTFVKGSASPADGPVHIIHLIQSFFFLYKNIVTFVKYGDAQAHEWKCEIHCRFTENINFFIEGLQQCMHCVYRSLVIVSGAAAIVARPSCTSPIRPFHFPSCE